jgi:hypothetical protein
LDSARSRCDRTVTETAMEMKRAWSNAVPPRSKPDATAMAIAVVVRLMANVIVKIFLKVIISYSLLAYSSIVL